MQLKGRQMIRDPVVPVWVEKLWRRREVSAAVYCSAFTWIERKRERESAEWRKEDSFDEKPRSTKDE